MLAFALGGASCVWSDLRAARAIATPDIVVACNDAAAIYPGQLDAFVTLHPDKLPDWLGDRERAGHSPPRRVISHQRKTMNEGKGGDLVTELLEFTWPGHVGISGSSGLFCVRAALEVLKADKVLLAGVPMDDRPHFFDSKAWTEVRNFRQVWESLFPSLRSRVRSMSGWTQENLGAPDDEWINSEGCL